MLAVLAYGPLLLSSPGRVSADSKQYLYLDPGAFLARIPYVWDAQVGAGGVSHQHIGYLWPMGPWFWLLDAVGIPTWVAQRLWVGTLSMVAALGTRWLLRRFGLSRAGVVAGTLVYLLSPYPLAFTARTSVLLLPWAALPWLMGLTDRAVRDRGWRDPAWIALVVATVGSVNASSMVLVGVGPLLWLGLSITDRASARRAAGVAGRVGVLGAAVSLWWIVALGVEGRYGLPVLQVTENLDTVASASNPSDVLRGLGNWYFYGQDRLGFSIDQAEDYLRDRLTVAATFGLSALALASALLVRWRHRTRFAVLVLGGVVVSVGAWPIDEPSPFARVVADFTSTSAGLALRNTARTVPVVVLGLAGLVGAAVSAWRPARIRWGAAALVGLAAMVGLAPVAREGMLSEHQDRVDPIPSYWRALADDLDRAGPSTRVLEIPGSNFAAFRWGNAVDPILPGLMDRGQVSREVLPLGSASSVLLIDALDRRTQEGTLEPSAVAPVARLFAAGDVVLRSDLEYERFRTPNPRDLWRTLTADEVAGLEGPVAYGPTTPNRGDPALGVLDEVELRNRDAQEPPAVARFRVEDPVPIVRAAPTHRPVLLAGDGDGIVDAAAAGLVDGRALVLQAAWLSSAGLRHAVDAEADLVLTDTYRRRIQTWFYAIRDTRGPTERAGETLQEPTGYDQRIDPNPAAGDEQRTVVEQVGASVSASLGGGAARPEDRAAVAFDGDPRTAWRVGGADPRGTTLRVRVPEGVPAEDVVLLQPQDGPRDRVVTEVEVRVDGGPPRRVALTDESLTGPGQPVPLGTTEVRDLEIVITGVSRPPFDPALANAVGFAEVDIGGLRVVERVRVPTSLLDGADGGAGHALDLVLTRLRYEPGARGRQDQERSLQRTFDLPRRRAFALAGTLRVQPNAPDHVLDQVLGTDLGGAVVRASSHLAGDLGSRASRALDEDPRSAWQTDVGPQEGERLTLRLPAPTAVAGLTVTVERDERHSTPGRLRLVADGQEAGTADVPAGEGPVAVTLPDPSGAVRELAVELLDVRTTPAVPGSTDPQGFLPVAITSVTGAGVPTARDADAVDARCRPLLELDGEPLPVRAVGPVADARGGLALEPCAPVPELDAGAHVLSSPLGVDVGIDVDRVVLSSDPEGRPTEVAPRGQPRSAAGAEVVVLADRRGSDYDLELRTDGEPFWLVLGQSDNRGWDLQVDGATVGEREVVDGYANGWLVRPDEAGDLSASLTWEPQRQVWLALAVSAVAAALSLVLVVRGRRSPVSRPPFDRPRLATPPPGAGRLTPGVPGLAVGVGLATLLVATPVAGAVASAAVVVGALVSRATWLWAALAAALVLLARALEQPGLAWVALALLAADLVVERWRERVRLSRRRRAAPTAPRG